MSPESAPSFSAFGMYFAKFWEGRQSFALGLVVSALGDTSAEMWLSRSGMVTDPVLRPAVEEFDAQLARHANGIATEPTLDSLRRYAPCCLFNGMIHPLARCRFRGVIWYQGESNGRRGAGRLRRIGKSRTAPSGWHSTATGEASIWGKTLTGPDSHWLAQTASSLRPMHAWRIQRCWSGTKPSNSPQHFATPGRTTLRSLSSIRKIGRLHPFASTFSPG